MRSTTLVNSANENTAAAVMLTTPAMVVASKMEISVGSILLTSYTCGSCTPRFIKLAPGPRSCSMLPITTLTLTPRRVP
jgi:hypothetical protein